MAAATGELHLFITLNCTDRPSFLHSGSPFELEVFEKIFVCSKCSSKAPGSLFKHLFCPLCSTYFRHQCSASPILLEV